MSNDYFKFKQFTIRQDRCAMKVGTDGTLLGAWASAPNGPCRILDVGTGTGLIALMMAQRFPQSTIIGIDIDNDAVTQAIENVKASPFANQIQILKCDIADFQEKMFDVIVSNPPFFISSLECPDDKRTTARHTKSLSYETLMRSSARLLDDKGHLSVIVPTDYCSRLVSEASLNGFNVSRKYLVKTSPRKPSKRCLIEFVKYTVNQFDTKEIVLCNSTNERSDGYNELVKDFYIK